MSQSGNKFIKSMSLINLLPQKIQEELSHKSLLKVISGLSNLNPQSAKKISEAALETAITDWALKLFNPEIIFSKDLLLNSF